MFAECGEVASIGPVTTTTFLPLLKSQLAKEGRQCVCLIMPQVKVLHAHSYLTFNLSSGRHVHAVLRSLGFFMHVAAGQTAAVSVSI